jgi:putative Mg2+ transporter-C (MgtC) family protein
MIWEDTGLRLLAAVAAGLALGLEREWRGHAAGVRTHVLVSVGAAPFTLAGAYGFADIERGTQVDPARIAAQVASGIGFIGAGAILRDGTSIKGLTTAATLWLAASVGVTAGAGAFGLLILGTGVVLVLLIGVRYLRPSRWRSKEEVSITVVCRLAPTTIPAVLTVLRAASVEVGEIDIRNDTKAKRRRLELQVRMPRRIRGETLVQRISSVPEVREVSVRMDDDEGGPT